MVSFSPQGVEIAYEANTFYWDAARDAGVQALLTTLLHQQFGQPVNLKLIVQQEDMALGMSLAQLAEHRRQEFERGAQEGALGHPAVRSVMTLLGGEVQEVRTLGSA